MLKRKPGVALQSESLSRTNTSTKNIIAMHGVIYRNMRPVKEIRELLNFKCESYTHLESVLHGYFHCEFRTYRREYDKDGPIVWTTSAFSKYLLENNVSEVTGIGKTAHESYKIAIYELCLMLYRLRHPEEIPTLQIRVVSGGHRLHRTGVGIRADSSKKPKG